MVEENLQVQAGDDAADALWFDVKLNRMKTEKKNNETKSSYELILTNPDRNVELKSLVEVAENNSGLLKEKSYQVIDRDGIAFDHSRIIVQALKYIEEQIL